MQSEELTTAEQLALRLMAGDEDPLVFQSLRYAALAQANEWELPWLARELVELFDQAAADDRSVAETAAVTAGLLKAARLGRTEAKDDKGLTGRINPAVVAAGITAIGLIVAATINFMGHLSAAKAKPTPQPTTVADTQPNVIQIVVPTPLPTPTPAAGAQPAGADSEPPSAASPLPIPTPTPTPVPAAADGGELPDSP